jgi:Ca2+/H+ antiporter, TMEM165/GDT1 family
MNIGLAAATFAVVVPAELPDKTFLATISLAARQRVRPVFVGAFAGLVVQGGIAVVAGGLLSLAPRQVIASIAAFGFLSCGAYLALSRESGSERRGEKDAERVEHIADERVTMTPSFRLALTTFAVIVLAEFGDLTQIVLANLAAKTKDALSVFVGAVGGFLVTTTLGVAAGRTITRFVPLAIVRKVSAAILVGLGIWSAVAAAGG